MSLLAALDYPIETPPATALSPRLRVVLLGCGTVNAGVLAGLEAMQTQVEIAAIITRKPRRKGDERYAWLTDLSAAFDTGPDLVIDGLPDCATAEKALTLAVERGIHIISANKAVIARRPDLEARARKAGTGFAYSAAVGGGVPVLETVARLKAAGETVIRVRGVLNGTSNYVLGLLEKGIGFDEAIAAAQAAGFAEEDPGADLDGLDAAAKLALIARAAFDIAPDAHAIMADSLFDISVGQILGARENGLRYRQIAELVAGDDGITANVRLTALPEDHPLARVENEENAIEVCCASGTTIVLNGKGAGQAPTAASILSDVRALLAEGRHR